MAEIYEKIVLIILQHHKNKNYKNKSALTSLTDDLQMPADMKTTIHGLGEHAYHNFATHKPFSYEEFLLYISDHSRSKNLMEWHNYYSKQFKNAFLQERKSATLIIMELFKNFFLLFI